MSRTPPKWRKLGNVGETIIALNQYISVVGFQDSQKDPVKVEIVVVKDNGTIRVFWDDIEMFKEEKK